MAFFALALPQDIQEEIAPKLDSWRQQFPAVKWVHPQDYHITLRFLGPLRPEQSLSFAATSAINSHAIRSLQLRDPACFLQRTHSAVLYIGLVSLPLELLALQQQLEQQARALGLAAVSSPYVPHLTIGRYHGVKAGACAEQWRQQAALNLSATSFQEYRLMQRRKAARDGQQEPMYETLAAFPLAVSELSI